MQKISMVLKIDFIFFLQNVIALLILLLLLFPFDVVIKYKPDLFLAGSWDELVNQSISDIISLPYSVFFIARAESCLSVCVCLQCVFLSISTVFLGICGIWFPSARVKEKLCHLSIPKAASECLPVRNVSPAAAGNIHAYIPNILRNQA